MEKEVVVYNELLSLTLFPINFLSFFYSLLFFDYSMSNYCKLVPTFWQSVFS